jgi:hypothetical protein
VVGGAGISPFSIASPMKAFKVGHRLFLKLRLNFFRSLVLG